VAGILKWWGLIRDVKRGGGASRTHCRERRKRRQTDRVPYFILAKTDELVGYSSQTRSRVVEGRVRFSS
jgi:hypothetical protein